MASHALLLLLLLLSFQLMITASFSQELADGGGGADKDRRTLLKIKEQMGNPLALGNWRPGTDHCQWLIFVECDERRRVIYLIFRGFMFDNFTSTLPPAIGELDQLQALTIVGIEGFSGPIPDTFGDLKHLSSLLIARTSISGAIPASLSGATSLASIQLPDNKLTGSIPRSLSNLPRLTAFFAMNNYLTGPIPPLLVRSGGLALSNNRLAGTIHWTYGVQRNLYQFSVANNQLTGDASFMFGRRKAAAYMDLSGNMLRFNLTGVEIPPDMRDLNLARNRIYGRVPAALAQASKLAALDLSYNELCGEIPTGGKLAQFTAAAYEHNACLCGAPLPPC